MRKLLLVLVLLGFFGGLINASLLGYAKDIPPDSRPISIDFKDIDLKDLLDILSAKTGLNIIATPEVQGRVPVVRFERPIPILKALKIILEPYDYQYEIVDNIIRVSPIPLLSQSFTLKSALVAEVASSLKPLLSEVGKMELSKETNTLLITDKKKRMEEIARAILKLDEPARQLSTHSFSLKFVQAEAIFPLIQPHLSRLGKLEVDSSTNTLLITDTRYNLLRAGQFISKLDYFRPSQKLFALKFALAPQVAKIARLYLSDKGKIEVNEAENQIMLTATSYNLKKIEDLLAELDSPHKQMKKEKFLIRYISLKDLAEVVKENLSSEGKLKIDPLSSTLTVEDTSYHLFQIEKIVAKLDAFQPRKRIYKISFAPLSLARERVEDLLSDQGTVEIQKETSSLVVVDVKKNLDHIDKLVKQIDTLKDQLVTKRFFLKYLTPQEAEFLLQGVISESGKIRLPHFENTESRSSTSDYIVIPQEKMDSPEENNPSENKINVENNIIYVTDLKRNMPQIEEVVKEMNGPSRAEEIATRTFYIKEGSLERIAIAIANMLGVPPEEIEGIELKKEEGKWMQMNVPSLAIDLGKIGPVK